LFDALCLHHNPATSGLERGLQVKPFANGDGDQHPELNGAFASQQVTVTGME